ncbi:hypothetical protein [Lactiplantibacillus plantarum]|uniref:hypothetical protein n=1 Tax=Lactiplantibacillus plantarum TaxID=1590 RepID=UPI001FEFD4E0|nr:hypothetical protein [Lactiplantibacillus plantarum]
MQFSNTHQPPTSLTKQQTSVTHSDNSHLTEADVVGVWINHHNKDIHQQITFTADHKWKENQHHVTNIYSGTWKVIGHNQISLSPYGEKIQLSGHDFSTMDVLNYHHILNKQKN